MYSNSIIPFNLHVLCRLKREKSEVHISIFTPISVDQSESFLSIYNCK